MKYKIITTFKPNDWNKYAKRMVQSVLDKWPNADTTVYYQQPHKPDFNQNVTWVDIDKANPDLHKFREKYKNDPVDLMQRKTHTYGTQLSLATKYLVLHTQ